ncbi:nicotinamide riboside kinase 1-like isoform X1 [Halichondria panicea]|uniref:nicotinamide riboside kinase 1-like isoform X1 n=1 Tax=Halichondria panicea TaxID=6063 RepID=UPI00312BAFF6
MASAGESAESSTVPSRRFLIGISGASCSGKSSLSEELSRKLRNCLVIHQDDYYLEFDKVPKSIEDPKQPLWDVPEAIDCDRFTQAIRDAMSCEAHSLCMACQRLDSQSPHSHIIIEGTMILSLREVRMMMDKVLFITLDYEACKIRRNARDYGECTDPPGYLEQHVWPGYLRELEIARSCSQNVNFLIGSEEKQKLLENCLIFVTKQIGKDH